ncbi:MAG TPA: hypothetical protein PLP26_08880 [Ilumatobacteraceae bacterium]|nr:hypothetical protein [Ilumatobacteraceae bacterium]
MTGFAGLNLRCREAAIGIGGSFVLRSPAPESRHVDLGHWAIDVIKGSKAVVARSDYSGDYAAAFDEALAAANRGLDMFAAMATDRHLIENADEEHLIWWPDSSTGGVHLAARAEVVTEARVGTVVVTAFDENGAPIPPTPGPTLQWHPSYRYFRVSQTTHDLHDAYRNGFLALESLLDHVTPQVKEGESKWFRRAMAAAEAQVHLAAELVPDATSPLADLCDELYGEGRTTVAHSKSSRKYLLPHDYASRSRLLESLHRLHRFYLGLAAQVLGLRRGGSYFAPTVLRAMDDVVSDHIIYVTDDASPIERSDGRPSPAGRPLIEMTPVDEPGRDGHWWSVTGDAVASLDGIRRIVSARDGQVGLVAILEADLMLDTVDRLDAYLSIRTLNASEPQLRFST